VCVLSLYWNKALINEKLRNSSIGNQLVLKEIEKYRKKTEEKEKSTEASVINMN
jgi:hypothetical protein